MKKNLIALVLFIPAIGFGAEIDMQAHVASDEGLAAYSAYKDKQSSYYTGDYSPEQLLAQTGNTLFASLNTLMGNTCAIAKSSYSYDQLRYCYESVDMDLNIKKVYIIGFYDGRRMGSTWDPNKYNREHVWPQSKGVSKDYPMGYDVHAVRPAYTSVNEDRGNQSFGEGNKYYDPNDTVIDNPLYKPANNGTYRGDVARILLYCYITYGQCGRAKNALYNTSAQLLGKTGTSGVIESLPILLKWHMQDPPSLTEMVRNDGAQGYQNNRNPFIDYPELAIQMLKDNGNITAYSISYSASCKVSPRYTYTTASGLVCYLGTPDNHPSQVTVQNGKAQYDTSTGRLTVTNVSGNLTITAIGGGVGLSETHINPQPTARKVFQNGKLYILKDGYKYDIFGNRQ